MKIRIKPHRPLLSAALVLLLMAAVFTALAVLSFQRRNLTVGAWPWQRGRVRG
jgi:hypothetical protein